MLFMPFGGALAVAGVPWWRVWLAGALLSTGIEYAQLYIPGRDTSIADVVSNSSGALAGCAVALTVARSIRRRRGPSLLAAAATSALAVGVIAGTGRLLKPAFPTSTYFGQWTPDLGGFEWYRGQVLRASLDEVVLPSARLGDSPRVHHLLSAGKTLKVRALAGPRVAALAPVFSIFDDQHREIVLLGIDRDDLVFRYRTRAAAWRLDQPALIAADALRGVRPGDTLDVVVQPCGREQDVTFSGSTRRLGFTAGDGWALLAAGESLPAWLTTVLRVAWVAGLVGGVGFWCTSRPGVAVGAGTSALGLAVGAPASGLAATPALEWLAAACGFALGAALRVALARLAGDAQAGWAPNASVRTSSPKHRSILA